MASALSVDLRERVVAAIEAGASRREAVRRFEISPASAVRWYGAFVQERRTQAKIPLKPPSGLATRKWRALFLKEEGSNGEPEANLYP